MPVEFLNPEQRARYGCYTSEPTRAQLARYFYFDDTDKAIIIQHRGNHNRLGFALQLGTVRFLGTFLSDPTDVPSSVINYVAAQLKIVDNSCLKRYQISESRWDHTAEIKQLYGYRDFNSQPEHWRLLRWLYTRTWLSAERPSILFDLTTARLVERKILLPGVTTLERTIAQVRERVADRVWRILAFLITPSEQKQLEELLVIPATSRLSPLERLRRPPTRISSKALVAALNRLVEIRSYRIGELDIYRVPFNRLLALARYANTAWAPTLIRMPQSRRLATLVAFIYILEQTATDDVLDLLDLLITELLATANRTGEKERLQSLKDFDTAALQLCEACGVLLDPLTADEKVRNAVWQRISATDLAKAVNQIKALAREPDDNYYDLLLSRWRQVRIFLPLLLKTIHFQATKAGAAIIESWEFLKKIEGQRKPDLGIVPLAVVSKSWAKLVIGKDGNIDRKAYTFCVLEQLRAALRRRDVFVEKSTRFGDPRVKLLQGAAWETARKDVCRTLNLQSNPEEELKALAHQLDEAYRRTAGNLPTNTAARIEMNNGREDLILTGLDKLEDPASLVFLKELVKELLPRVDLPEVLLEVNEWTGFADEFTHVNQNNSRVKDLSISICAVLLAEACNIGLEPLIRPDIPALTKGRLSWVQQNYIRQETLVRANARLVEAQTRIPLAQVFGGGEVASADGLRFTVPVRTLNAGPNPKYFGVGRGITYYNFTSDQFTGFHGIVIPGTLRDSLFLLDGLLEQTTILQPKEIMTDTAGYSDVVFGLFWLLGYQFSPRLADIGESRFWRIDTNANYGALDKLARSRINLELISKNWDDLLRVAGSLKLGTVSASELMQTLLGGKNPTTLSRAIGELGRIAKTLYLLAYIDDETYRRRILIQLNRGEGRHRLSRAVFYGQRGEVRQRYREGQEDQLGALGLVVNVIVLWNTRYIQAAIEQLRTTNQLKTEVLARLSPLGFQHINMLGRYQFSLAEPLKQGQLRNLRQPEELEKFDDFK